MTVADLPSLPVEWSWWLPVAGVFLLAGLVKGVLGLGLPTVAMALLALWMTPAEAAALLLVPSLLTNLQQAGPRATLAETWRPTWRLHAGIVAGALAGGLLWGAPSGTTATVLLGVVLLAYALLGLGGWRWQQPAPRHGMAAGVSTGVLTALTGVFVVPSVPWLQSIGLPRDRLVQAMGIAFTAATLALGANLWLDDALPTARIGASLLLVLPAMLGMRIGARVRGGLSEASFRRWLFASLAVLGGWQLLQAAW